eukprot:10942009-Alexandrium_andersonii.AAC.1
MSVLEPLRGAAPLEVFVVQGIAGLPYKRSQLHSLPDQLHASLFGCILRESSHYLQHAGLSNFMRMQ